MILNSRAQLEQTEARSSDIHCAGVRGGMRMGLDITLYTGYIYTVNF